MVRYWISLKLSVLIAASLAGLVYESAEAPKFNWYENTDQQVILVGHDSSETPSKVPSNIGPQGQSSSNFPTPPSGGRPSRPIYVLKSRIAPKVVDQELGTAANPASAGNGGGAAEFDDQCAIPKKQQLQESKTFDRSNHPKKKKQSVEQCELDENVKEGKIEIVSRIKEGAGLVRAAEQACKNADVQKDVNRLEEQLANENYNPGIGRS